MTLSTAKWLGRHLVFIGNLATLGKQCADQMPKHREIERKYLLSSLPNAARRAPCLEIEQGWLPGDQLRERLRRTRENGKERWHRTVKLGRGLERTEIEEATSRRVFEVMWPLTEGCRVTKRRFKVMEGALTWELDEFTDRELVLAEVELPSADFVVKVPNWIETHLVRQVTGEPAYVNLNLAK